MIEWMRRRRNKIVVALQSTAPFAAVLMSHRLCLKACIDGIEGPLRIVLDQRWLRCPIQRFRMLDDSPMVAARHGCNVVDVRSLFTKRGGKDR